MPFNNVFPPDDIYFPSAVAVGSRYLAAKVNKYRKILLIVFRVAGRYNIEMAPERKPLFRYLLQQTIQSSKERKRKKRRKVKSNRIMHTSVIDLPTSVFLDLLLRGPTMRDPSPRWTWVFTK